MTAALACLVVGMLPAVVARPAPAAGPAAGAFIDSEVGDTAGGGATQSFAAPGDLITPSSTQSTFSLTVACTPQPTCSSGNRLVVNLATANGAPWAVQSYEDAQKAADTSHPGLDVQVNGVSCTTVNGRFQVLSVTPAGPGPVASFTAVFEQHCNGDGPALFGVVTFNPGASSPYYMRTLDPTGAADFGSKQTGTTTHQTFTITNTGPSDMTPALAGITGTNAADFAVASHTCTAVLHTNDHCSADVTFTPSAVGSRTATLTFTDELAPLGPNGSADPTGGLGRDVILTGTGEPPPPTQLLTITPKSDFGTNRVGLLNGPVDSKVTNTGEGAVTISDLTITGTDPDAFLAVTDCVDSGPGGSVVAKSLAPGATCTVGAYVYPTKMARQNATITLVDSSSNGPHQIPLRALGTAGYFLGEANGAVLPAGDAGDFPDMAGRPLNKPIVTIGTTSDGDGYWLLGGDGGIFNFGDAPFLGSMGDKPLNAPVNGIATTPTDKGYWLVASDGGIFAFGDATFRGSMGGKPLNKPVVGMARTPSGTGYWQVASDGGIFAWGAPFFGSMGGKSLNKPIVGMAPTASGNGYWLVASDGGLFAFGDAKFFGSAAGRAADTIVGMAATPTGKGYWLASSTGQVFAFGDAPAYQVAAPSAPDVVGIAPTAPPVDPTFVSSFAATSVPAQGKAVIR
ncbi:MAG TPA: choice-of-anchor D domain-containing protein [Acidimicrobiales bacterium]|nr:choice-of-anchor D domain-containing protein [Acidimicrobiales bacterium]